MATREETKRMIEVMQAYVDGKEVRYSNGNIADSPSWSWFHNINNYYIADPYAELKAAAKDPTKQIYCHGEHWFDGGDEPEIRQFAYSVNAYEIRDKPVKQKVKLLAYLDCGQLFWLQSEQVPAASSRKRIPSLDYEVEVEE